MRVIPLELRKKNRNFQFPRIYKVEIAYTAETTGQVQIWSRFDDFLLNYAPLA